MGKYEILQDVCKNGARKITETVTFKDSAGVMRKKQKSQYLDHFSASAIIQVADALNETNREKYLSMPWYKMADFAFKHVTGCKSA